MPVSRSVPTMKKAPFFFALVMAAFGLAGCSGGTGVDNNPPDLGKYIEQGPPAPDLARMCVSMCTVDTDCQNSCPSPSNGVSCCDTTSGQCYTSAQSVCPAPPDMAIASSY
jgi:hypothetical protein